MQSGLHRPEQRWRGPARNKIALWSVLPGAAIVILVGGLFWASMWIAFRSPSVTIASQSSDQTDAGAPSDDGRDGPVVAAPITISGTVIGQDDQGEDDDEDVTDDLAMANRPADLDDWNAAHRSSDTNDRDVADDQVAVADPPTPDDWPVAASPVAPDTAVASNDQTAATDRVASDAPTAADDRTASSDREVVDGQDVPEDQVVAGRTDDANEDALVYAGPVFGPAFGPEQLAAILASESPDDGVTGDQVANAGSRAMDRAEEIAARAGELAVRAEELTARIDGLTAKIDELQAKLETGTGLLVQPSVVPSPVPAPRVETAAARSAQGTPAVPTPSAAPGKSPWVVLPQPEPGSRVAAGPVTLETRARGAAPITQIRLQIDGLVLQVALDRRDDTTWRGRATTRVSPGTHTVAVAVVDGQGRVGSYQWKFDASPS